MAKHRPLNAGGFDNRVSSPTKVASKVIPVHQLPGASELIAAGFEPLEELTGVTWIGQEWPGTHRRSLPETRPENLEAGEDVIWFVRSPWPTLTAAEAISLLWSELPRDDEQVWPAMTREVMSWPEDRIARHGLST